MGTVKNRHHSSKADQDDYEKCRGKPEAEIHVLSPNIILDADHLPLL